MGGGCVFVWFAYGLVWFGLVGFLRLVFGLVVFFLSQCSVFSVWFGYVWLCISEVGG